MRTIEEVVDEIARYNSMDALAKEYVRGYIGKRLSEILTKEAYSDLCLRASKAGSEEAE